MPRLDQPTAAGPQLSRRTCPGINADPLLGPLPNNNGPTKTIALGPGSPAIDAANDATCAARRSTTSISAASTRPQGLHCDIGAVRNAAAARHRPSSLPGGAMGATTARRSPSSPTGSVSSRLQVRRAVRHAAHRTGAELRRAAERQAGDPGAYSFQLYVEDSATWKNQGRGQTTRSLSPAATISPASRLAAM